MPIELTMPALSPTMEAGTLARWIVTEGDAVRAGDPLAEIETDKATMEFESPEDGRIGQLLIAAGDEMIAVGTPIALLLADGESGGVAKRTDKVAEAAAMPAPEHAAAPAPTESALPPPAAEAARVTDPAVSPLAARIAAAAGLDLDVVSGSGSGGRILLADLALPGSHAAAPTPGIAATPAPAPPPAPVAALSPVDTPHEAARLSPMRRTIAQRLTLSKTSVPHFYLSLDCAIDALALLRGEINAALAPHGVKISLNDMLIRALAVALERVPDANVMYADDMLLRFSQVDVAVAVAVEGGLVTPVIVDAGALSLSAIAAQSRTLAERAREGTLAPGDYAGGTVSISNLGMYGVEQIIPVLNPPQAVIMGIGAGRERLRRHDGVIGAEQVLTATASFDHRGIDGATGAQLMAAFRDIVENPLELAA